MVDSPGVSALKGRLDELRQTTVGSLWTNLLSPRTHGIISSHVRPRKVRYNYKVRKYYSALALAK